MSDHKFFGLFLFLNMIFIGLIYVCYLLIQAYPFLSVLFAIHFLNALGCYVLIGIGLGLPLIILASMLSWGQLALLMSGNVDPHLSKEGFFKVLNTLFKNI